MAVKGYQVIIFEWCMVIYTLFLVYLRLTTRLTRSSTSRPLNLTSDIFVVLAWLSFIAHAGYSTAIWKTGFMEANVDPSAPDIHDTILAQKLFFVNNQLYLNCMYAVKFSMLSLFLEFFPRYMKWTRRWVIITIIFTFVAWNIQFWLDLLWCLPISRNWSLDGSFCTAAVSKTVMGLTYGPHYLSDLMIYILPFPVIFNLGLPKRQKIGLALTFSAGFLCIFFAVLVLASIYFSGKTPVIWIMAVLEQTNAVIVVCSPAVKSWAVDGKRMNVLPWNWGKNNETRQDGEPLRDPEVGVLVVEMRNDMQRHTSGRKPNYKCGRESIGMVSTISDCKSLSVG